jgi:hypothetical protein
VRADELWQRIRRETRSRPAEAREPTLAATRTKRAPKEEFCLALLFREPALAEHGRALDEVLFSLSENRELFRHWRAGEAVTEDDEGLWEQYQLVLATRAPQLETGQGEEAFLNCVASLEQVRMRAVKEASTLAIAEGEAGIRPGQVASIARSRLAPLRRARKATSPPCCSKIPKMVCDPSGG